MVRAQIKYGVGITTALLLLAGVAAASPVALFEGGGEAAGEATGGYYVDASGAIEKATEGSGDVHDTLLGNYDQANKAYEETRSQVWQAVDEAETPQMPQCTCDELFGALDQVGDVNMAHADSIEKAADLESEYVDAGVDVGAAGQVKAWFSDVFTGAKDAFRAIEGLFLVDTSAADDVKESTKALRNADDDLRDQVRGILAEEHQLPSANPRLDGSMSAQHATEATSSALGQVQGGIP